MGDAFRKVRPGDPVSISAAAWNRVIDQVAIRPRLDASTSPYPAINFQVRCRNATSGDVARWGVLQITGVLETPTGATGGATGSTDAGTMSFLAYPGIVGVTPTATAGARYVVATQPIKAGGIGQAAIDGVVQCKLDVIDASHGFATPKPGSTTELKTASSGEAAILWKESGTGTGKWGLVRIGAGSGGGVKVGKITGTWTKGTTQTVWEYTGGGAQASGPSGPLSLTGVNMFVTVAVSGTSGSSAKWVAVASIDSTWHLIAAECS
jgi:hypothetical protein